jgi:hypothetical protein
MREVTSKDGLGAGIVGYLCILTFPLLSYLFTNLGGRYIGIKGSCIIATMSIFLSFFFSIFAFYEVALNGSNCYITLGS